MTTPNREAMLKDRSRARLALLVAGTLLVALAGYTGFRLYPSIGGGSGSGAALVGVAAATGFAAFFSPCSFPLMLTMLGRQAGSDTGRSRLRPALRFALAASIGASAFVVGFGMLLSIGGGAIARQITFTSGPGRALRIAVGLLLITMGLAQLGRIRIPFFRLAVLATPIERRRRTSDNPDRFSNHVLYGFGYLIAGFG
jgi:cytochrome c biogenesis protein CcdA